MSTPLPAGMECYDCNHVGRCTYHGNTRPGNIECTFTPGQYEQNPGLLPGAQIWNAPDDEETGDKTNQ